MAFDSEGVCIGYANITSKSQNNLLTIFGNDAYTSCKDGAKAGELISFRAYDPATGLQTELTAIYNESFPNHNGLFASEGLSQIISLKHSTTSISETALAAGVQVYPNPAKDVLTITLTGFEGVNMTGSKNLSGLTATIHCG